MPQPLGTSRNSPSLFTSGEGHRFSELLCDAGSQAAGNSARAEAMTSPRRAKNRRVLKIVTLESPAEWNYGCV